MLAGVTFGPAAMAQVSRYRGEYMMVAGHSNGSPTDILYIVDQNSRELVAIRYDTSKRLIQGMGYADLAVHAGTVRRPHK